MTKRSMESEHHCRNNNAETEKKHVAQRIKARHLPKKIEKRKIVQKRALILAAFALVINTRMSVRFD